MLEKLRSSALAKLFVAMIVGVLLGNVAPGCVIRVLNSFGTTFAQLVKFIAPLIIVGLVTPAIADAKRGAGRMMIMKKYESDKIVLMVRKPGFYLIGR